MCIVLQMLLQVLVDIKSESNKKHSGSANLHHAYFLKHETV